MNKTARSTASTSFGKRSLVNLNLVSPISDAPVPSLRSLLLGSVCLVGLLLGSTAQSRADSSPCVGTGASLACSGDLSEGVLVDPAYSTVTIGEVTSDVGSAGGVVGLRFDHSGDLTVTSDTGEFGIVGSGIGLHAIHLSSIGGEHTATLTQVGDVTSDDASAAYVTSWGDVSVAVTGNVSGKQSAIVALSIEQEALAQQTPPVAQTTGVTVIQTGDVISYEGSAIYARAPGFVDVTADGDITAKQDAISASNFGTGPEAVVSVKTSGTIISGIGSGIVGTSNHNDVVIDSASEIEAQLDGIRGSSLDDTAGGNVAITQTGKIIAYTGAGIYGASNDKAVTVTATGNITSGSHAIWAKSTGDDVGADVTVNSTGNLTSYNDTGISAEAINKRVSVTSVGAIQAKTDGIYGRTSGNDTLFSSLTVNQTGAIVAYDGYGVNAVAAKTSVDVTVTGAITSKKSGIDAVSTGSDANASVVVNHSGGQITSYDFHGIEASSSATNVTVINDSEIQSKLDGIHATMTATNAPNSSVTVSQAGHILTYSGYGIYATATEAGVSIINTGSIDAKMGGIYGYASGAAANAKVNIENSGDIFTYDGSAIYALATSQDVDVKHHSGTLSGGSYGIHAESLTTNATATIGEDGVIHGMNTAAVYLRGITGTTVTNYGEIDGDLYELAIQTAGYGGSVVNNYGILKGNVEIDSGFSSFNNELGGLYDVADLAFNQGGLITNDGTLSPGGVETIHEAHIGGNLVQSDTGILLIDASATVADKIIVAGNVELSGGLQLKFSDFGAARQINILNSYWIDVADLTLKNNAVDATILYVNDTDVVLDFRGLDFAAASLSDHSTPVGDSLTAAYNAGSTDMSDLFAKLANMADDDAYQAAIDQLTPNLALSQSQQGQVDASRFADTLMSCPAGSTYVSAIGQSSCFWGRGELVKTQQDETLSASAYDSSATNGAIGGQVEVNESMFLGLSLGTKDSSLDAGDFGNSTQSSTQYGAALKYVTGSWLFSAALSGGNGSIDTTRFVTIGDLEETLSSSRNITTASLRLRAANSMTISEQSYIKSVFDLNATRVAFSAATETGGISALDYAAGSDMVYSIAPSLELGTQLKGSGDLTFNPFVRLGAYSQTGSAHDLSASFVESDAADGGFTINTSSSSARATVALGLNIVNGDIGGLNLVYSREMGDGADVETIALKGVLRF